MAAKLLWVTPTTRLLPMLPSSHPPILPSSHDRDNDIVYSNMICAVSMRGVILLWAFRGIWGRNSGLWTAWNGKKGKGEKLVDRRIVYRTGKVDC
jgi:hypothetical protein